MTRKTQAQNPVFESGNYRSVITFLRNSGYRSRSKLLSSRRKNFTPHEKSAITQMLKTYAKREKMFLREDGNGNRYIAENEEVTIRDGVVFTEVFRGALSEFKNMLGNSGYADFPLDKRNGTVYQISLQKSYYNPIYVGNSTFKRCRNFQELEDFISQFLQEKSKGGKDLLYMVKKTLKVKRKNGKGFTTREIYVPAEFVLSYLEK